GRQRKTPGGRVVSFLLPLLWPSLWKEPVGPACLLYGARQGLVRALSYFSSFFSSFLSSSFFSSTAGGLAAFLARPSSVRYVTTVVGSTRRERSDLPPSTLMRTRSFSSPLPKIDTSFSRSLLFFASTVAARLTDISKWNGVPS